MRARLQPYRRWHSRDVGMSKKQDCAQRGEKTVKANMYSRKMPLRGLMTDLV